MSPDRWGGLVAGVVAPVAVLWLVIGYFINRREIKNNTAMLRDQSAALNRLVEEMGRLVFTSELQATTAEEKLSLEKEKRKKEEEKERRERMPSFDVTKQVRSRQTFKCWFKNSGGVAGTVQVRSGMGIFPNLSRESVVETGETIAADWKTIPDEAFPFQFSLISKGVDQKEHEDAFSVSGDHNVTKIEN